jgi:hypothetical protein
MMTADDVDAHLDDTQDKHNNFNAKMFHVLLTNNIEPRTAARAMNVEVRSVWRWADIIDPDYRNRINAKRNKP